MEPYTQDPDAELDYGFDWGKYWLGAGDEIDTSSWSIEPSGELQVQDGSEKKSTNETSCILEVADGVADDQVIGKSYMVTNHIVTIDGYIDERSLIIRIQER